MNERGDHFPILGICLGFELLTYVAANCNEHRSSCSSKNEALPLEFKPGKYAYKSCRLNGRTRTSIYTSRQLSWRHIHVSFSLSSASRVRSFAKHIYTRIPLSDFRESNLFRYAPSEVVEILEWQNVTANYHQYCVTEEASVPYLRL